MAVVPSYDRIAELRVALEALRSQSRPLDRIIVIDNASSPNMEGVLRDEKGIETRRLDRNAGAPGGYQAGLAAGVDIGADWVWLVDDDSVPAPDALERMLAGADRSRAVRLGACVPTMVYGDGREEAGWLVGAQEADNLEQRPRNPEDGDGAVDWAPFAGLLLRTEAVRSVGPLSGNLYLWHSDIEYCLRLRLGEWTIQAVTSARVWHPARRLIGRRVLWRRIWVSDTAPWREYYDVRDLLALRRVLRGTAYAKPSSWRGFRAELKSDLMLILADRQGGRRVCMRALGFCDGLFGWSHRAPEQEPRSQRQPPT